MHWEENETPAPDKLDLSDFPQAHWWWLQDKDRGQRSVADQTNGLILSLAKLLNKELEPQNLAAQLAFEGFSRDIVNENLSSEALTNPGLPSARAETAEADSGSDEEAEENNHGSPEDDVMEALKILTDNENIIAPILRDSARCHVDPTCTDVRPAATADDDAKVIIGVIDDGIAIANSAFRIPSGDPDKPDSSRVHSLWQQDADCVKLYKDHPFGRIYLKEEIDTAIAESSSHGRVNEIAVYRRLDLGMRGEPPGHFPGNLTHGVHVAGLAAGTIRQERGVDDLINDDPEAFPIVAVNLPTTLVSDTAGSFMAAAVILGIRNILETATQINPAAPVVINLSFALLGSGLGGANLIARYIDAVTELWEAAGRTLIVVLPAGNNYDDELVGQMTLPQNGGGTARFEIDATNEAATFVEFVIEKQKVFTPESDVRLELESTKLGTVRSAPSGQRKLRSSWTLWGHPTDEVDARAAVYYGFRFEQDPASSGNLVGREVVTLALPPNHPNDGRGTLDVNGTWKAVLHSTCSDPLDVSVRILRNDDPVGDALPQSARLLNPVKPGVGDMTITPKSTLNAIAKSDTAVVVGGSYNSHGKVAPYSSSGPTTSLTGVDVDEAVALNAPCERNEGAYGLLGPGAISETHDGRSKRLAGTSVAAPVVSRWLVNYLAANTGTPRSDVLDALILAASDAPKPKDAHDRIKLRAGSGSLPKELAGPR